MQMEQAQIVIFDEQTIDRWLLQSGAAPRILRWGTKQDSRSERAEKKFVPPLLQMWGYKQANVSRGLLNILKFSVWLSH